MQEYFALYIYPCYEVVNNSGPRIVLSRLFIVYCSIFKKNLRYRVHLYINAVQGMSFKIVRCYNHINFNWYCYFVSQLIIIMLQLIGVVNDIFFLDDSKSGTYTNHLFTPWWKNILHNLSLILTSKNMIIKSCFRLVFEHPDCQSRNKYKLTSFQRSASHLVPSESSIFCYSLSKGAKTFILGF